MPGLTRDQVLEVLRQGTPERRTRLLAALPGSPLKAVAAGLVESEHPGMVVVALAALVQDYCYGSDPSAGAVMADALHQRARELWEDSIGPRALVVQPVGTRGESPEGVVPAR